MTLLVDTSVLIDHLRGRPAAIAFLHDALTHGERLVGSVLTRTEILAGMRPDEEDATQALLSAIDWVPVTEALADTAGALARTWSRAFSGIDTVDFVLAATAQKLGVEPTTRNVTHFPMFPDLRAPY